MKIVRFRSPAGAASDLRLGTITDGCVRELAAASLQEWLAGSGRATTGKEYDLSSVELCAPLDCVPSFRDFTAYEFHTRNILATLARMSLDRPAPTFPEYWYEAPGFYFSNPAAFHGPDEPVHKPSDTEMFDFELEIAGLIDADGELAGFMLLNDWSARDVQLRELVLNLGPHKSKDFSTSIGPWFVTIDELDYRDGRLHMPATVSVNGTVVKRCDAAEQYFTWPQLLAQAARGTALRPADLIGSGTLAGGCLLESGGLPNGRWLASGDVVALSCDELGTLSTPII